MKNNKRNTGKKEKRSLFSKILLGAVGVGVIIIIVVDCWLWGVLSKYEKREAKKDAERAEANQSTITSVVTPEATPSPIPTEPPKLVDMQFKVKDGVTVYVDGTAIDTASLNVEKSKEKEFEGLYTFINQYPEYNNLPEKVTIPELSIFNKEIYENSVVTAKDASGADVEIQKYQNAEGDIFYSTGFNNDESKYDEVTKTAWDFAVAYSYFVAGDRGAETISKYFPSDSKYYRIVASVDTAWYTKHSDLPTYSDRKVTEFKGYSENLFYVELYMKETIYAMYYNDEQVDRDVSLGLWLAKLGDGYKVCGIVYK